MIVSLNREDIVKALVKQKRKAEEAVSPKERSIEMMNLVLLRLYIEIPPGRAKEIRTAQLYVEKHDGEFQRFTEKYGKNFLVLKNNGDIMLYFDEYKTRRSYGSDVTVFEVRKLKQNLIICYLSDLFIFHFSTLDLAC